MQIFVKTCIVDERPSNDIADELGAWPHQLEDFNENVCCMDDFYRWNTQNIVADGYIIEVESIGSHDINVSDPPMCDIAADCCLEGIANHNFVSSAGICDVGGVDELLCNGIADELLTGGKVELLTDSPDTLSSVSNLDALLYEQHSDTDSLLNRWSMKLPHLEQSDIDRFLSGSDVDLLPFNDDVKLPPSEITDDESIMKLLPMNLTSKLESSPTGTDMQPSTVVHLASYRQALLMDAVKDLCDYDLFENGEITNDNYKLQQAFVLLSQLNEDV